MKFKGSTLYFMADDDEGNIVEQIVPSIFRYSVYCAEKKMRKAHCFEVNYPTPILLIVRIPSKSIQANTHKVSRNESYNTILILNLFRNMQLRSKGSKSIYLYAPNPTDLVCWLNVLGRSGANVNLDSFSCYLPLMVPFKKISPFQNLKII